MRSAPEPGLGTLRYLSEPMTIGRVVSIALMSATRRLAIGSPTRGRRRVGDLVADRPQHDGRRVLGGVDHLGDVAVAVGVEEAPVVELALGRAPGVEGLDHHHDPELLADLDHLRRGRVVRGPERVDAHALHDLHLAHERVLVDRRAERALVVVQVDAVDLHRAPVEREALRGVEVEPAHAEGRRRCGRRSCGPGGPRCRACRGRGRRSTTGADGSGAGRWWRCRRPRRRRAAVATVRPRASRTRVTTLVAAVAPATSVRTCTFAKPCLKVLSTSGVVTNVPWRATCTGSVTTRCTLR